MEKQRKILWICQTRYEEGQSRRKRKREDFLFNLGCEEIRFKKSTPYEHGDLWARIPLSSADLQMYTDTVKKERVLFVFKEQIAIYWHL